MATIVHTARGSSTVNFTITAGGGETAFQIEANRSPDFASDESFFQSYAAAGAVQFGSLTPDTPWYFRVRKTNSGNGAWSATYLVATTTGNALVARTGFSHDAAILVVPEPITDLAATNMPTGPVTNLIDDDPMALVKTDSGNTTWTWRSPGRSVDSFAILGTLANEDVTVRLRGATSSANLTAAPTVDVTTNFRAGNGIGWRPFYHWFYRLAAPQSLEWWSVLISGYGSNFVARHLVYGLARQSINVSRGAGHSPNDLGQMGRTQYGSPDRVNGWRGRMVDFPLSWLREAEYQAKWSDLFGRVGTTDPVLALPNPKAHAYLNDRIAYGHITSMRDELMRGDRWAKTIDIASLY